MDTYEAPEMLNAAHPLSYRERAEYILSLSSSRELFIETGTGDGYMANHMGDHFDQVFSIEIVNRTYNDAVIRFAEQPNVKIIYGDSVGILPRLMHKMEPRPMTLWLDAHDNGELPEGASVCPIMEELAAFFQHRWTECVVLIDDIHLFGDAPGYPEVDEVARFVQSQGMNYKAVIDQGVLRIQ